MPTQSNRSTALPSETCFGHSSKCSWWDDVCNDGAKLCSTLCSHLPSGLSATLVLFNDCLNPRNRRTKGRRLTRWVGNTATALNCVAKGICDAASASIFGTSMVNPYDTPVTTRSRVRRQPVSPAPNTQRPAKTFACPTIHLCLPVNQTLLTTLQAWLPLYLEYKRNKLLRSCSFSGQIAAEYGPFVDSTLSALQTNVCGFAETLLHKYSDIDGFHGGLLIGNQDGLHLDLHPMSQGVLIGTESVSAHWQGENGDPFPASSQSWEARAYCVDS